MKTVAVIGASKDRAKFGNKAIRAYQKLGWTVYPINPKEPEIEGLKTYASILDTPERPEMVSIYVAPPVLLKLLPDIAKRGCDELWLNPGTESDEVLALAESLGLKPIQACSLIAFGMSPSQFV